MIQKKQLIQPIQDQIFAAVQDIAQNKKYDFIFDKSADVVMLFSAERFDMSEQVLRAITRASKRKQVQSRQDKKNAEAEDVVPEVNWNWKPDKKKLKKRKMPEQLLWRNEENKYWKSEKLKNKRP